MHRFKELGPTLVLSDLIRRGFSEEELARSIREFCGGSLDLIYGNSVASGREYRLLNSLDAPIITHFHELEMSIKRYAGDCINDVLKYSSHFIACSGAVKENLIRNHGVDPSKITMVHASINPDGSSRLVSDKEKHILKKKLGLKKNSFLIFGCGLGMVFRKGGDLFIEVARALRRKGFDNFHFYWIGHFHKGQKDSRYGLWADHLAAIRKEGLDRYVTFLGLKDNPREYLQAGDAFLLPSREDPFPLVALEAAECGLPTICFAETGGMLDFVEADAGFVVPHEDVEAAAEKIAVLMENEDLRRQLGIRAREKLLSGFTFEQTTPHILSVCRKVAHQQPAVSIIVPNYNHARYLPRRLDSIFTQTFKDFEVILLDDASTDDSMGILEKYASRADVRIIGNEVNTGSPCKQWLKGIDLARADILWIAESDDVCEPQFLETLIPAFQNHEVKLAYSDSYVIDENDRVTGDYVNCEYLTALSKTKWKKSYRVSATEEINDGLGVKNTILNISAVLFRKFEFGDEFRKTLEGMRIAGDWNFIVHAIKDGKVHYEAKKLNYHRRHSESIIGKTISEKRMEDFFREFHITQEFIVQNYELNAGFKERWESYLRNQWNDFCPGRPFQELRKHYPLDEMREKILRDKALTNGSEKASTGNAVPTTVMSSAFKSPAGEVVEGFPSHEGVCPICGPTQFVIEGEWLRDQYYCSRCRSIPRWRALIHVLETEFPRWRELRIHESSPFGPASNKLKNECPGYSSSHFFPDVPLGSFRRNIRCEDLESLTFRDQSFDVFITQDVMEHVFEPLTAFREIARVLRPGGAHVFTVPVYRREKSLVRASRGMYNEIEYLMPPDYHGNPIDSRGSLVITEWGWDIVRCIWDVSGMKTDVFTLQDQKYGLDGEFLDVFVSRKESEEEN